MLINSLKCPTVKNIFIKVQGSGAGLFKYVWPFSRHQVLKDSVILIFMT